MYSSLKKKDPISKFTLLISMFSLYQLLSKYRSDNMEFSRQEYWSEWPFPSPGDLPNTGIKPVLSALQADYPLTHQGNPIFT